MQAHKPFRLHETHGMLLQESVQRKRTSEDLGWSSLFASMQVELPFEGRFDPVRDQLIVWHRDGPVDIEGQGGAQRFHNRVPAGGLHLIPGGAEFSIRLDARLSTMHVYVRRETLMQVASDLVFGDPEAVVIQPAVLERDDVLRGLLRPLEATLRSVSDSLYADYLALTLAAHLIENYSNAHLRYGSRRASERGLSPKVEKALTFMRDNLDLAIGIDDIAREAGCSASHISREMKSAVGLPPHRYLVRLRVERAKELLATTRTPIAEIAFECGFTHQEHLCYHFRRICRTTPASYRRNNS